MCSTRLLSVLFFLVLFFELRFELLLELLFLELELRAGKSELLFLELELRAGKSVWEISTWGGKSAFASWSQTPGEISFQAEPLRALLGIRVHVWDPCVPQHCSQVGDRQRSRAMDLGNCWVFACSDRAPG